MKSQEVEDWLIAYDNPQKELLKKVREIVLASDDRVEECIKWKSPTFTFNGNIASFNPRTKKHVSLMFHTGASIPGDFPSFEGSGDVARYMKFNDEAHLSELKDELESVIKAWCKMKE